MRKSLQKTPPSALSSHLARLSAGLLDVGAPRHAPKKNGRANGAARPLTPSLDLGTLAARLRLAEGFISRTDVGDCAQSALQWLADTAGVSRSVCLIRPVGESVMTTVATYGLPFEAAMFSFSVDDWSNPLTSALDKRHTFFPAAHNAADRRRRPTSPFEDAAFHAIPIDLPSDAEEGGASCLLLLASDRKLPDLQWFTTVFSQKFDQILRQR